MSVVEELMNVDGKNPFVFDKWEIFNGPLIICKNLDAERGNGQEMSVWLPDAIFSRFSITSYRP